MTVTEAEASPETRVYIPPAFGRRPETVPDALEAAAALLDEEGRWGKGDWFSHDNPEHPEYNDNPFCNGWKACAEGALQIVTLGVERRELENPCVLGDACLTCRPTWVIAAADESDAAALFFDAEAQLVRTLQRLYGAKEDYIPRFNDKRTTTREDVVNAFREAAGDARNNETEPVK